MMIDRQLKISVIVPSFNQGSFIEETLLSVVTQDYKNIELIVIDGGSTDQTLEIIKKYETHLSYWISEKDNGQSEAINKGLKKATGDIVTWLNSDDCYEKDTLQYVNDTFLKNPKVGLLHGKTLLFGEKIKSRMIGPDTDLALQEYLPYMRFPQPSSFFRKNALDNILPVNNNLHYAMDFELIVKFILAGFTPMLTSKLLSRYRMHAQSKSNNDMAFLKEWTIVFINLLHSVDGGQVFINKLNQLNIGSVEPLNIYGHSIVLSGQQLEDVFLKHLNLHFHYNYRAFNYADCKRISDFLKKYYLQFYIEKQYKKFMLRLKFVPKFIFSLLRTS